MEMEHYIVSPCVLPRPACSIVWTVLVVFTRSSGFFVSYLLTISIIRLTATPVHDFGHDYVPAKAMYKCSTFTDGL
jgi:hypothetical protein